MILINDSHPKIGCLLVAMVKQAFRERKSPRLSAATDTAKTVDEFPTKCLGNSLRVSPPDSLGGQREIFRINPQSSTVRAAFQVIFGFMGAERQTFGWNGLSQQTPGPTTTWAVRGKASQASEKLFRKVRTCFFGQR